MPEDILDQAAEQSNPTEIVAPETPITEQPQAATPELETPVDYVGGLAPDENDAFHKQLQADYTRKTQALAAQRKQVGELEQLGQLLESQGISPRDFANELQKMASQPSSNVGYAPTAPAPAFTPQFAPQASTSPEMEELERAFAAAETYGEQVALQNAIAQRRQLDAIQQQIALQTQQQQQAQRQWQIQSELSRLESDPRYRNALSDQSRKSQFINAAYSSGRSLEEVVQTATYGDQFAAIEAARREAYQKGLQDGRNGRATAEAASLDTGRSTANVQTAPIEYRSQRKGKTDKNPLLDLADQAEERGLLKWQRGT